MPSMEVLTIFFVVAGLASSDPDGARRRIRSLGCHTS